MKTLLISFVLAMLLWLFFVNVNHQRKIEELQYEICQLNKSHNTRLNRLEYPSLIDRKANHGN